MAPSAEVKAVRAPLFAAEPACPVTAAPSGPPLTMPTTNPAGVARVAANVQAVPFGERYTSTAGLVPTVAGLTRMNPKAVTAAPLIWAPGGTASVQVAPPSRLSHAAPVRTALVWAGAACPCGPVLVSATSPAIRIWFR